MKISTKSKGSKIDTKDKAGKSKDVLKSSLLQASILFKQPSDSPEEIFRQRDLVQLFPYGMSVDMRRPFLILKDKTHEQTLPVAINPLEAGVTLSQSNKSIAPVTTHKVMQIFLESLNIQVTRAVFVEIKGVHQYVRLYLSGHPLVQSLKVRADEAMSLCLFLEVPLYATKAFISKSKVMTAEIEELIHEADPFAGIVKNHPYMN